MLSRVDTCWPAGDNGSMRTYFVLAPRLGAVKIGVTRSMASKRISDLQVGSGTPLVLVGEFTGNREAEFHKRFDAYKIHGEWFRISDGMIDLFKEDQNVAEMLRAARAFRAECDSLKSLKDLKRTISTVKKGAKERYESHRRDVIENRMVPAAERNIEREDNRQTVEDLVLWYVKRGYEPYDSVRMALEDKPFASRRKFKELVGLAGGRKRRGKAEERKLQFLEDSWNRKR